jgi:glycerol-3-phosphate dehydrogenase (NAD(P)+)
MDDYRPVMDSELVICAVPSGVTRPVAHSFRDAIGDKIILSTAKGIEQDTLLTMSQIIREESGGKSVYSISGPTFADELIRGYLSSATMGIDNDEHRQTLSGIFGGRYFALDFSHDVRGVELAGVLKNIYAIALGIFDSVDSSYNGHYTFLSLCYKEMTDILRNCTTDPGLIEKFCAFGDYNLTANVDKSRNRTLGLMIGKKFLNAARINSGIVFEGLKSIKCILALSQKNNLKVPIVVFVNRVLEDNSSVMGHVDDLLNQFNIG